MSINSSSPIVFTGSSIIEYWKHLEEDMAPLKVLNRGVAGSKIREIVDGMADLVLKYHPRAIVLYAGSNDLQGETPPPAEYILNQFRECVETAREEIPAVSVIFLSIASTFLKMVSISGGRATGQ
jgi:lysophospholipase L1-like esterase